MESTVKKSQINYSSILLLLILFQTNVLSVKANVTENQNITSQYIGIWRTILADLTGDGTADLIMDLEHRGIVAVDGETGNRLWLREFKNGVICYPFAATDINEDEIPDIFLFTRFDNKSTFYALDGNNLNIIWNNSLSSEYVYYADGLVDDLNGDGQDELLIGLTLKYTEHIGQVFLLDARNGELKWNSTTLMKAINHYQLADFNQDEILDIALVSEDCWLPGLESYTLALNGLNGELLWTDQYITHGNVNPNFDMDTRDITIADFNNDNLPEIMVSGGNFVYLLNGTNGEELWLSSYFYRNNEGANHLQIAYINNDNVPDVMTLLTTWVLGLDGIDGTILWENYIGVYLSETTTIDLTQDLVPDYIVGSFEDTPEPGLTGIYAINGKTGGTLWECTNLRRGPNDAVGNLDSGKFDVNGDGTQDIAVTTRFGFIYAVSGQDGQVLWETTGKILKYGKDDDKENWLLLGYWTILLPLFVIGIVAIFQRSRREIKKNDQSDLVNKKQ